MIQIVELNNEMDRFDEAVKMFWEQWGNSSNFMFYQDCIVNSCQTGSDLPRFYLAWQNDAMVGTYALLRNDLISRQDLVPWLACLYVIPELRGNNHGSLLLQHALNEAYKKGYEKLYLCTDLNGYYEKHGWSCLEKGYLINGNPMKIYAKETSDL